MKRNNALTRLGHALTHYLKTSPDKTDRVTQPNKRNLPVAHSSHQHKPSRNQQYSDHYGAERVNRTRTAIVNPDGSYIAIDIYSRNTANARRRYRKAERRLELRTGAISCTSGESMRKSSTRSGMK